MTSFTISLIIRTVCFLENPCHLRHTPENIVGFSIDNKLVCGSLYSLDPGRTFPNISKLMSNASDGTVVDTVDSEQLDGISMETGTMKEVQSKRDSQTAHPFASKFMLEKKCTPWSHAWSHECILFSLFPFSRRPLISPSHLFCSMPQTSHRCAICQRRCNYCCSLCRCVFYCNKEHQQKHWLESHRIDCTGRTGMLTRDQKQLTVPPSPVTKNEDGDWVFI